MSILNPVISKFNLVAGTIQEVYVCPANKSHAIVDLTFYKDNVVGDSLIEIALTTEANPANLTSLDYFIDDIQLVGIVNSAELNKIIVGKNERLYLKVISGNDVVVRLSGVEEDNIKVGKAGRLAASSIPNTAQTQLYTNAIANITYISCSLTIYNSAAAINADVEAWITTAATPGVSDKIMKISIPPVDTSIIENILLGPTEKIFVKSSQVNTEYFVNGIAVLA